MFVFGRQRGQVLFAIVLATLPVVHAAPASGELHVEGPLRFALDTESELIPIALLLEGLEGLSELAFAAPEARVCEGWRRDLEVSTGGHRLFKDIEDDFACYTVHDMRATLLSGGDHAGWLGLHGDPEARLHVEGPIVMEAKPASTLASEDSNGAGTPQTPQDPHWPYFTAHSATTHLTAVTPGRLTYTGPAALLLKGPDIHLKARENETTHATHDAPKSNEAVRERELRWVHIQTTGLTLTLQNTGTPAQILASTAHATWDGTLRLDHATGWFQAGISEYHARGQTAELEGTFASTIRPASDTILLGLTGDLRTTTLAAATSAPAPPETTLTPRAVGLWSLILLGAALASWVSIHHFTEAHRAHEAVRRCDDRAFEAANRFDYAQALKFAQQGRALAPHDADLAMLEATMLKNLGRTDEALEAYEHAARLAEPSNGEPDYWAAVLCLHRQQAGDLNLAFNHADQALRRQPQLAWRIEDDTLFTPLSTTEFAEMLAKSKLSTGPRHP